MSNGGSGSRRSVRGRHRSSDASDCSSDHRNHRHCFLPNSVHHQKASQGGQGALRGIIPSLPSSPSTIITNIEQDREDRDVPMEMTALVVFEPSGQSHHPARFHPLSEAAGAGGGVGGGGGSVAGREGGPSGRKRSSTTVQVLVLMERCSNSSTETFDF